ncbi:hypothetical protein LCGC14_2311490, partial [marine sediment metagenome]
MRPSDYLAGFVSALECVVVTFHDCAPIPFNEGVEWTVKTLSDVRADKKKVMLVGNGAEASIASHIALDLWKLRGIRAVTFSDAAQLTALANDCGAEFAFSIPIKIFGDAGDVVFALSCSGESSNVLQAAAAARKAGYPLVTLTGCEPMNALRKLGDVNFYVPDEMYGVVESAHALIMHCVLDC